MSAIFVSKQCHRRRFCKSKYTETKETATDIGRHVMAKAHPEPIANNFMLVQVHLPFF